MHGPMNVEHQKVELL